MDAGSHPLFDLEVVEQAGACSLKLRGECDLSSVEELSDGLQEPIDAGKTVVVDLSELEFLDSSCLRTLLTAWEQTEGDGRLTFRRGPQRVMRVFEIAGVSELLPFE